MDDVGREEEVKQKIMLVCLGVTLCGLCLIFGLFLGENKLLRRLEKQKQDYNNSLQALKQSAIDAGFAKYIVKNPKSSVVTFTWVSTPVGSVAELLENVGEK
ncbi:MAG: hypothetical protein WC511_02140 [Candidatus Pacearchaeota archaeon]